MALANQAAALEALGRNEESAETYEQSADLFKGIGEMDLYASTLQSLSTLQLRMGRQLEALAIMQAGIAKIEKPTPRQRLVKKLLQTSFNFLGR